MTFFYDMNKKLAELDKAKEQLSESATPAVAEASTGDYSAKKARAGKDIGKPGKNFAKIARGAAERYGSKERGEKVAGAVLAKLRKGVEEGNDGNLANNAKPYDKVTRGDVIAGRLGKDEMGGKAKKKGPVDEVKLADLPVRQVKGRAYGSQPEEFDQDDDIEADDTPKKKGRRTVGAGKGKKIGMKIPGKSKLLQKGAIREGDIEVHDQGEYGMEGDAAKDDIHTLVRDARALEKVLGDTDDLPEWVQAKLTKAKGMISAVSDYMQTQHERAGEPAVAMDEAEMGFAAVKKAVAKNPKVRNPAAVAAAIGRKKLGQKEMTRRSVAGRKDEGEELDEKAVSVAQRRAAGIAHAAQKGEIPKSKLRGASKEMAKMAKGELHKFAATKEKGLPKKKAEEVEETTTSGSVATAPAAEAPKKSKGGMQFGKGIYDSMNRDLEAMISESMSINISSSTEGGDSVSVTASDEDAAKLKEILRNAGLAGGMQADGHSDCGCGTTPCSCAEVVDENQPDWPTDEVTSDDALQYSGGLNKPKHDVAGDGQTTVPVSAVRVHEEQEELDESKCNECGMYEAECKCDESVAEDVSRILELAGVNEAAKPDFLDVDKDGNKKEPMKKAADEKDDEKIEESILNMSRLWKAYKAQ